MKFGSELNDRSILKWKNYNIDYNDLKNQIKLATTDPCFDEDASSLNNTNDSMASTTPPSDSSQNTATTSSTSKKRAANKLVKRQRKILNNLYNSFKDQIDFVSLFVLSKYGEISRRLVTIKNQLNNFINVINQEMINNANNNNNNANGNTNGLDINKRLLKKRLVLINKELNDISIQLQDLSRFILLQKIALRKLFKKFLKYSNFRHKQELVNKIQHTLLNNNPNSFVNLYLNDSILELTLMFDILNNYFPNNTIPTNTFINPNNSQTNNSPNNSSNSFINLDTLTLSSNQDIKNVNFNKSILFDLISKKKGTIVEKFWIHKDNVAEIKFYLLSQFKLVSDDTGLIDEINEINHMHQTTNLSSSPTKSVSLKHTKSTLDLRADELQNPINPSINSPIEEYTTFKPATQVVSLWLNNLDSPRYTTTSKTNSDLSEIEAEVTCRCFTTNSSKNQSILISPLGGLRQFAYTILNESLIDEMFTKNLNYTQGDTLSKSANAIKNSQDQIELKDKLFSDWSRQDFSNSNPKMAQLSIDFVIDNKLKPLAKVTYDRTRFIYINKSVENTNTNNNGKIECYITFDDDIKSCKVDSRSQFNTSWTEQDEANKVDFPYSILEIRYENPNREKLPQDVLKLIESHLVYKIDDLNFSINNYLLMLNYSEHLSDDSILQFIAPWYTIITESKDIRKLPKMNRKVHTEQSIKSSNTGDALNPGGILLNKNETKPLNQRYWNEFDDGSDYENDSAFYIYGDQNGRDDDLDEYNDEFNPLGKLFSHIGFGFLNIHRIEKIIQISNKVSDFLRLKSYKKKGNNYTYNGFQDQDFMTEHQHLLQHDKRIRHYQSYSPNGFDIESDTDDVYGSMHGNNNNNNTDFMNLAASDRRRSIINPETEYFLKPSDHIVQIQHDNILVFMYMTSLFLSYLSSGVGMGVIFSVISNGVFHPPTEDDPDPTPGKGITLVVVFALISMILALIFNIVSICLLISRYSSAPLWHHILIWFTLLTTSCLFISSIMVFL